MKTAFSILLLAATTAALSAQTAAKPATAPAKTATAAKTPVKATAAKPAADAIKLPPGVKPVKGPVQTAFSLRYQDILVGTGADAEPGKMYKVLYTGYRAADGVKFDSSDDHRLPLKDKDGKPVLDEAGKPKLGEAQPMSFPQGMGRLIPGFDQGFTGMKVGGQRRLFIPWQLAYGTHAMPDRDKDHPGIPAKSDLIFDVTLVEITDLPTPPQRPGMMGGAPHGMVPQPGKPGAVPAPGAAPAATPAAAPAAAPAAKAPAAAPAAPATPAATK